MRLGPDAGPVSLRARAVETDVGGLGECMKSLDTRRVDSGGTVDKRRLTPPTFPAYPA